MTICEVQERIRASIEESGLDLPAGVYMELWELYKDDLQSIAELCQYHPQEVDWEAIFSQYWVAANTLLRQQESKRRFARPRAFIGQSVESRKEGSLFSEKCIEEWWQVLPERDKQQVEQAWEFAYNAFEFYAYHFRKRYTGGAPLSPEEAIEWFKSPQSGCVECYVEQTCASRPSYILTGEDIDVDAEVSYVQVGSRAILFSWQYPDFRHFKSISNLFARFPAVALLVHLARRDLYMFGVPPQMVMLFMLTGQKFPARVTGYLFRFMRDAVLPILPPYLSTEGVSRIWQTLQYRGSAKSWFLSRFRLNRLSTYVQAWKMWNQVAPADWRIPHYRAFRTEWLRAKHRQEWEKPGQPESSCRAHLLRREEMEGIKDSLSLRIDYSAIVEHLLL